MEYIIQSPNKVVNLEREDVIRKKFMRFEKGLVTDRNGKIIETIRIAEGEQPEAVIDLKGKPPGLYFVNVRTTKGLRSYKVMLE